MSQDAVYFNVWFSACYMRLRERLSYYDLDEDAFHDTYLLVREKALCSVGGIADFEAYFRACYRHAVLHRHRTPRRDVHPGTGFFLRLCDEGPTVPEEELGACERLVLDILAFIRRSFPHEVCRLFLLRYYESPRPCSYRLLAQYAGTTPSRAAREVKAGVQTDLSHGEAIGPPRPNLPMPDKPGKSEEGRGKRILPDRQNAFRVS